MRRTLLKICVVFTLVASILQLLLAALLCLLGLPAFVSTISGTTAILMAQADGADELSRAFVMASGGIMFLVQGVLGCIKAACGLHGLSSGRYRKFIFVSGVIACSTFFQALLGMFSPNVDSAAAVIMFQIACIVLACAEQAHPSAKKERPPQTRLLTTRLNMPRTSPEAFTSRLRRTPRQSRGRWHPCAWEASRRRARSA